MMHWLKLLLIESIAADYTDVYNFPMFGVLWYDTLTPEYNVLAYGSVTIVHEKMVIAAAENLAQLDTEASKYIFNDRQRLKVHFGSDILQPPKGFQEKKIQFSDVDAVYFGWSSEFVNSVNRTTEFDDVKARYGYMVSKNLDLSNFPKTFKFNPFSELQWDVAILTLKTEIKWTQYILPIAFHYTDDNNIIQEIINFWTNIEELEDGWLKKPCSVPGWSTVGDNQMIFHQVVYVRFKDCAEAICGAYPSACLRYLNSHQHICFKSLSFVDSCILDQGAPVVCSWAKPYTLGILVKTFECGAQQLPSVFTRTYAIEAFARLIDDLPEDKDEPNLDDPQFTLKPV